MKIRYSQWTRDKMIAINSLRFDPKNPRLAGVGRSEKAVIEALAETEDLGHLLQRVIQYGLAPIERLVVVYQDSKPIVVEGNRRLAVFKLLRDPDKAPTKLANLVRRARNELGTGEIPSKAGCDIPRDAAEADVYAYMKHAEDKHFRPWAKIQQALIDCEIANKMDRAEPVQVQLTETQIRDARAMVQFYRLAGILSRDPASGIKSETLRDFPYEAVKRTLLSNDGKRLIGIAAGLQGVEVRGDPEGFTEFFRKILAKMGEGRATRTFNTADDFSAWVETTGYKPTGLGKHRLADCIEQLDSEEGDPPAEPKPSSGRSAPSKPPHRTKKIFPEQLQLGYHAHRLEEVLGEVENLNLDKQRNSSAVMLRCVLELAVDGGLQERKLMDSYLKSLKGGKDILSARIQWLRDASGIEFDRDCKRVLNQLLDGRLRESCLDSLNGWVHSRWWPATSSDVRDTALKLTPLLLLLMKKVPSVS